MPLSHQTDQPQQRAEKMQKRQWQPGNDAQK
jgi:hypothetical protein